jgi:hypothetical protein
MEKKFVIALSRDELQFLCSSINETLDLEAVKDWEFQTRTGSTPEEAKEILVKLKKAVHGRNRDRTASEGNRRIVSAKLGKLGDS